MHNNTIAKLRERYLENERKRKAELVVVCVLWLIGCPVLCAFSQTNSGTIWGKPDPVTGGLPTYSISASMTGHYPKIWGSIFATLFAVLVVQRTSNGLCPALKLGWLGRFSPLITNRTHPNDPARVARARELWKRIERIETFGYVAGSCLVGLVILDSKYFPVQHVLLAQIAFMALYRQDWSVGTLGLDFPELLPTWTSERGKRFYYLGIAHFALMMIPIFVLQTLQNSGLLPDFSKVTESPSERFFGNPNALKNLLSVTIWYNEYAFGLICIYVQLLDHFEIQLWDFVGEKQAPYLEMLPRFAVSEVLERAIARGRRKRLRADDVLLAVVSPMNAKPGEATKWKIT